VNRISFVVLYYPVKNAGKKKLEGHLIYEKDVQSFDDCVHKQQENVLHLKEPFFAVLGKL
jgi:hypothetical protein